MRFRVLSFNMQFGQVWDESAPDAAPIRLEETIRAIREVDADVVLLQEVEAVDRMGRRPEPPRHYPRIAEALSGMHGFFAYPPEDDKELPFGIGLAIFSKAPLANCMRRPLPPADIHFQFEGRQTSPTHRLLIGANTAFGGREVTLLNTHLQAYFMIGSTSDDYPEQRQIVESVMREVKGPALIGGDFNLGPGETLIQQFERAGYRTCQNESITWKRRPYVTDHIFYNRALRCISCSVLPTPESDHERLVAEFEILS